MARQRRRTRRQTWQDPINVLDRGLRYAHLGLLLFAIVVVPFIVLPESDFVDITSTSKATSIRFCGSLLAGILASRFLARLVTG